jgi:hypothetical protein
LVTAPEDAHDLFCYAVPAAQVVPPEPKRIADCGFRIADWNAQSAIRNPQSAIEPGWLRRLIGWGIEAASGPGLRPLRAGVRRFLDGWCVTRPLGDWLRREKVVRSQGFIPGDDQSLGVVILAHSLAAALEVWRRLPSRERMCPTSAAVVLTGGPCNADAVCRGEDDLAVYRLDALAPREYHPHALGYLLRAQARCVLYIAEGYRNDSILKTTTNGPPAAHPLKKQRIRQLRGQRLSPAQTARTLG